MKAHLCSEQPPDLLMADDEVVRRANMAVVQAFVVYVQPYGGAGGDDDGGHWTVQHLGTRPARRHMQLVMED